MSKNTILVLVLLLLCVAIAVVPLLTMGSTAEFGGSDDQAGTLIEEIEPEYDVWTGSLIEKAFAGGELPGEIESLLFCLQAALGSGIFFFCLGRLTMRSKMRKQMTAAGYDPEVLKPVKKTKND